MRKLLFALLFPLACLGQGVAVNNIVLKNNLGVANVIQGAVITVCTSAGTGIPCTPKVANIFSDLAMTVPITGPGGAGTTSSDGNGNFNFVVPPNATYFITISGAGLTGYSFYFAATPTGAVAYKYASASAYRYVDSAGSDSNDGLSPGSAFATPQHCNTAVIALGGGTCDARTLYSLTYSTEIDVGQHNPPVPVTLLLPPYGAWTCNVTGSANCLKLFHLGYVIGTSAGQGTQFVITASASAVVTDVCGTDPAPLGGGAYIRWEGGMTCASASGATVSGAAVHIQKLFDVSRISDIISAPLSTSTKGVWIHGLCCGTRVEGLKGDGKNTSGNVPCTFGSNSDANAGADIGPISCDGSGSGSSAINIVQFASAGATAHYHDIYTEMDVPADTTSPVVNVTGSSGLNDVIDRLVLGADQPSSTRYMVAIASGSSITIHDMQLGSVSANAINDSNTGRGTISPGASAVVTDYSTENSCCTLAGYFTKPSMYGITNNTGIQLFNTTTTCTTAATINTPCTTASITLPVGYGDANYRISCSGLTRTNFPQIIDYAKSNTTFTITLNNLTAAAATYSSFDCTVTHN